MHEKKLLRPRVVAQVYDIPEGYQAKMRCAGIGPEYIKIGSKIFYEEASIQRWLRTKRRKSTSDQVAVAHDRAPQAGEGDASNLHHIFEDLATKP